MKNEAVGFMQCKNCSILYTAALIIERESVEGDSLWRYDSTLRFTIRPRQGKYSRLASTRREGEYIKKSTPIFVHYLMIFYELSKIGKASYDGALHTSQAFDIKESENLISFHR